MAKVKIQGNASGTGILTVTAPDTDENRTITLPDATGTLLTEVADDAITLAKMASGTDGNVISYDASGNPVAVATGSAGQVLTSAGAGAPPTFAAGGLVLVASSVDMTGGGTTYASIIIDQCFTTDYENYLVVGGFGVEASGNCRVQMRIGGSGSESTLTSGNYKYVGMDYENENGSLTKNELAHDSDTEFPIAIDVTPVFSDGNFFNMWVYSPMNTATDTLLSLQMSSYDGDNDARDRRASCNVGNTDATGLFFANSSGNLDEHAIYVYGLVKS